MSVAIRKLEGVESVEVSLARGQASLRLRAGNRVTLAQLRQLVKNNGFSPREAAVTVLGDLVEKADTVTLSVSGSGGVLTITQDSANAAAYRRVRDRLASGSGVSVMLDGLVPEPPAKNAEERLVVREVHPKS